jgi:hypothetical protein
MTIPSKIKIKYVPDFYTKTIGKYADGQFMAMITATIPMPIPKNWEQHKRWYSVLHTFTTDGIHKKTETWFAGTASESEDIVAIRARKKRDEMISCLPDIQFCDVEIKLFSIEVDGFTFGLVDASRPEDNYESVHLLPNDFAFFAPWNGEYDT